VSRPGCFVVLEGGEGVGKSTQARRLAERLRASGHPVLVTREPGDSRIGPAVRGVLLDPANAGLSPRAEALLYAADRAEHVAAVIRPALAAGSVVVCDRYVDSSIAYQGVARGLGDDVERISRWATESLLPDLTVVLDVDPTTAHRRLRGRDRLEQEPLAFHAAVREAFLALAAREPARYAVVDAAASPDAVAAAVLAAVREVLPAEGAGG
jgi:dTMP kinase